MKKQGFVFLSALAVLLVMGCSTVTVPVFVNSNSINSSKVGEASATIIFGGIFGGEFDYSLQTAAKNGGITRIATVDKRIKRELFGYTITTVVTGE